MHDKPALLCHARFGWGTIGVRLRSAFVKRPETERTKVAKKQPFCLPSGHFGAENRPFFGVKVYWIINRKKR
jgi:hypothetical protein